MNRRFLDTPWAPAACFAVFLGLILFTIGRNAIWFDESYSLLLAGPNGFFDIAHRTAVDAHPPFWYWTLKPWLSIFGANILASRAEQALFMFAAVAVWYRFGVARLSRSIALLGLALLVTNQFFLHYAVEGRMYGLATLFAGISCTLVSGRWRWRWYAYWPLAVAMLYTHYFLAFVIAGQFLYLLLARKAQGIRVWWLVAYGVSILAAFAPWLHYAAHQTTTIVKNGFWVPPISPTQPLEYVTSVYLDLPASRLVSWLVFPGLAFVVAVFTLAVRAMKLRGPAYALAWCVIGIPWLALFALGCKPFVPVFHPRYVLFTFPALCLMLAAGALDLRLRLRVLLVGVVLVGQVAGIAKFEVVGTNWTSGHGTVPSLMRQVTPPIAGEVVPIIAPGWFQFFDAKAMLPDGTRVRALRDPAPTYVSTDAIYYDKPDWWVRSLDDVHAKHVWLIEDANNPETPLPKGWFELYKAKHGYARVRLIEHE
ncbi:MAG TPA: glycosyltransferase family 39 protein [Kofleriaceae bacterium]